MAAVMDVLLFAPGADPAVWQRALALALPDARIHAAPTPVACDYALVWTPDPGVFAGQTRLKAVFNVGAGVDAVVDLPGLPASVPLIRLEDAGMARQMVEYVTWGVLHHLRRFAAYAEQAAQGLWRPLPRRAAGELELGVLGLGVLGRAIIEGLRPFGFRLAGWSRTPKSLAGVETYAGWGALPGFLARAEVLVCVVPLTPATRGLLDARRLAGLPRGAFVINVARGAIVNENDLLAALASGQVGGALLDVFENEPLPAEHPFWRHPGVLVTPHVSAATLVEESIAQIAGKIRSLERGERVTGVVDRALAY